MTDEYGRTPLHYAVAHGQLEAVKLLIKEGAKINLQENKGNTPLHMAAGYGRLEELRALRDVGADISIKNGQGYTALEVATMDPQKRNPVPNHKDIMDYLKGQ